MRQMKIKIKTTRVGDFYFNVCSSNGQITSTSETYLRKRSAKSTAQSYIDNGLNAVIVDETK